VPGRSRDCPRARPTEHRLDRFRLPKPLHQHRPQPVEQPSSFTSSSRRSQHLCTAAIARIRLTESSSAFGDRPPRPAQAAAGGHGLRVVLHTVVDLRASTPRSTARPPRATAWLRSSRARRDRRREGPVAVADELAHLPTLPARAPARRRSLRGRPATTSPSSSTSAARWRPARRRLRPDSLQRLLE
jgi:hypothetical protein